MEREEILNEVKDVLRQQLGVDKDIVDVESRLKEDLGADSLDKLEMCISLEDRFDVSINDPAVENFQTIGDVVNYLHSGMKSD